MAVEEPRARVVRREPDGDIVACRARADGVALRRVHVVVVGAAGAADDGKGVLQVMWAVSVEVRKVWRWDVHRAGGRGGARRVQLRWRGRKSQSMRSKGGCRHCRSEVDPAPFERR